MSHWVNVKIKPEDESLIANTLKRMNINMVYHEEPVTVRYGGRSAKCHYAIRDDRGDGYVVGLQKQADGGYALVGDPYYAKDKAMRAFYGKNEKFAKDFSTAYMIEDTIDVMAQNGMEQTDNMEFEVGDDGLIQITYSIPDDFGGGYI